MLSSSKKAKILILTWRKDPLSPFRDSNQHFFFSYFFKLFPKKFKNYDYGKGIKPEERENLFEKYKSTDKFRKFSGLGLFIVKTLVERYGGEISVESRVADDYTKGTTFIIEFETT